MGTGVMWMRAPEWARTQGHAAESIRIRPTPAALAPAAVLIFALAAYGAPSPSPPYVINAILSLTGSAAFLGQAESQTLQILEHLANAGGGIQGHPVRIAIQDDQSSPQTGVQLANQVLARKVPVICGPAGRPAK